MVKPSFHRIPFRVSIKTKGHSPSGEGQPPAGTGSALCDYISHIFLKQWILRKVYILSFSEGKIPKNNKKLSSDEIKTA